MSIDTQPVETLDDCKRLGELVYSTYGLTYHRSFMYEPERLLELIRSGAIGSMVAIDRDSETVVGHQATIRPWFETVDPLPVGRGAPVQEVGLSIVHPEWRGKGIQNILALALLMRQQATNPDARGFYIKCLTGPLQSQHSARRFGGKAMCLFVAGVPAWVVVDGRSREPRQPLSTVLVHCPYGEPEARSVPVPAAHAGRIEAMYTAVGLPRRVAGVHAAPLGRRDSVVRTWFDPARRHGVVRVLRSGGDLVDAVADRVRWMVDGHIEHVTALLPLTSRGVAAAAAALEARGLFFGGVIPDLEGCDTLVLEWVEAPGLDVGAIEVLGDEGAALKEYVLGQWGRTAPMREAG